MAKENQSGKLFINAVIYDLDGVLVSTDEYHFRAWKRLAEEENIPFDRTINERLRGVSRMESLSIILERSTRNYSEEERRELAERKNGYYVDSLSDLGPEEVLPGAIETIDAVRVLGLKQAVASSSKNAPRILERTGLSRLFDAAVDGSMITRSKPDPEVFLKAAQLLKADPAVCVVIEDAVSGIKAANAAGMFSFAVASAAHADGQGEDGDHAIGAWNRAEDLSNGSLLDALKPFVQIPESR